MEPTTQAPSETPSTTESRWVYYAGRRWVERGSTHPRDVDGDPA